MGGGGKEGRDGLGVLEELHDADDFLEVLFIGDLVEVDFLDGGALVGVVVHALVVFLDFGVRLGDVVVCGGVFLLVGGDFLGEGPI